MSTKRKRGILLVALVGILAGLFCLTPPGSTIRWETRVRFSASPVTAATNSHDPNFLKRIFTLIESTEFFAAVSKKSGVETLNFKIPKPTQGRGTTLVEISPYARDKQASERLARAVVEELSDRFEGHAEFEVVDSATVIRKTTLQRMWEKLQSWLP